MDKNTLKQYRHCRQKIQNLQNEINMLQQKNGVHDVTTGSQSEFPYVKHTVSVDGCPDDLSSRLTELKQNQRECWQLMCDVHSFVQQIDDKYIREAIELRYMVGKTKLPWTSVAMRIGGGNTADGVRKAVTRFLQKN